MQVLPGVLAVGESRAAHRPRDDHRPRPRLRRRRAPRARRSPPRPLAHQNGQASLLGAAAAGARVRGMDAAEVSRAMRIATTLLLTPSYTNAVAGATTLNVAGGMSGFVGALAPELVLAGFEAQDDAIEEALGQAGRRRLQARRPARRARHALGDHAQLFPPLRLLQSHPSRARLRCRRCSRSCSPRPDDIERIDVATYRFASVMRNPDPPNYFASKYSLPARRGGDGR